MSDTVKRPLTLTPGISGGYAVLMGTENQGNLIVFAHHEVGACLEHMQKHFEPKKAPKPDPKPTVIGPEGEK